jgi:hypothetical protein
MHRYSPSRLLCLVSLTLAAAVAQAATPPDNVSVHYKDSQNFTEARNDAMSHRTDANDYLKPLKAYIAERAAKVLSPGQRMDIEVTDVDRAGEYEPWRGPRFDDVRIIKDIYPPRIDLNFTLYDADGKVLKQGSRKLRDIAFLSRGTVTPQQDPLRYEKGVIDLWLRGGEQKL